MVEVEIMPSALRDLKSIIAYVFERSVQNAEILQRNVFAAIRSLEAFPEKGRVVRELNNPLIREIGIYKLRIIYRVKPNLVQVLAIHHSARLLTNNPNWDDLFDQDQA